MLSVPNSAQTCHEEPSIVHVVNVVSKCSFRSSCCLLYLIEEPTIWFSNGAVTYTTKKKRKIRNKTSNNTFLEQEIITDFHHVQKKKNLKHKNPKNHKIPPYERAYFDYLGFMFSKCLITSRNRRPCHWVFSNLYYFLSRLSLCKNGLVQISLENNQTCHFDIWSLKSASSWLYCLICKNNQQFSGIRFQYMDCSFQKNQLNSLLQDPTTTTTTQPTKKAPPLSAVWFSQERPSFLLACRQDIDGLKLYCKQSFQEQVLTEVYLVHLVFNNLEFRRECSQ